MPKKDSRRKLLVSLAILGAAAGIAGLGTYATFTSSTSASQTLSSGTVSITLGASGAANRLTIGASGLLGGDTVERAVDLINNGSLGSDPLSSLTLTTVASPSSALDTDAVDGLQMAIDRCSLAWTEAGTPPAYTYTCSGTTTSVLAQQAIIGSSLALVNLTATATGATDHLRVTASLPATVPSTYEGLSSTIAYAFTGTQRAATSK